MLCHRGHAPKLTDIEALTLELVDELLGFDCDKKIWEYFYRHWLDWFPQLSSRSNFVRQTANSMQVKQLIHKKIIQAQRQRNFDYQIADGFPMPVCHYARSKRHCTFKTEAAHGYCTAKDEKYYGFKGNFLIDNEGMITDIVVTGANVDERISLLDMVKNIQDHVLGDMGFMSDEFQCMLKKEFGIFLHTPKRKNMHDECPQEFLKFIKSARRRVESVINQLQKQFHIMKI